MFRVSKGSFVLSSTHCREMHMFLFWFQMKWLYLMLLLSSYSSHMPLMYCTVIMAADLTSEFLGPWYQTEVDKSDFLSFCYHHKFVEKPASSLVLLSQANFKRMQIWIWRLLLVSVGVKVWNVNKIVDLKCKKRITIMELFSSSMKQCWSYKKICKQQNL